MAFDTRLIERGVVLPVTWACVPTRTRIWVLPGAEVAGTLRRGPLFAPLGSGVMSLAEPRISITDGVRTGRGREDGPVGAGRRRLNSVPLTLVAADEAAQDRQVALRDHGPRSAGQDLAGRGAEPERVVRARSRR